MSQPIEVDLGDGVTMVFREIPEGVARIGSREGKSWEQPVHKVKAGRFWMAETPVTQEQYAKLAAGCLEKLRKIEGNGEKSEEQICKPSRFSGEDKRKHPVEQVNWHGAREVAAFLTRKMRDDGELPKGFRVDLPGEGQWEFACRAGTRTEYHSGDGQAALQEAGWFSKKEWGDAKHTDEVQNRNPNDFQLWDVHGNVDEWCKSDFDEMAYRRLPATAKAESEPGAGEYRVLRGGSWVYSAPNCRSAYRVRDWPVHRFRYNGFRLALVPGPDVPGEAGGRESRAEAAGAGPASRGPTSKEPEPAAGAIDLARESLRPPQAAKIFSSESPSTMKDEEGYRNSEDGQSWDKEAHGSFEWPGKPVPGVSRIVIGDLGGGKTLAESLLQGLAGEHPLTLAEAYPDLSCLHLWGLDNLETLAGLPSLMDLDVQKCPNFRELKDLPTDNLEVLVLRDCPELSELPMVDDFPKLEELELIGGRKISEEWILDAVECCGESLWKLDLSGCEELGEIEEFPPMVEDLHFSQCGNLEALPTACPVSVRRLDLNGCVKLKGLPAFPEADDNWSYQGVWKGGIDYLNLADTPALSVPLELPFSRPLRTLFLYGSAVEVDADLKGSSAEDNVAKDVIADLAGRQSGAVEDHEVKVILLGNGRCGKTSLARCLDPGGGDFDEKENSTHGVKLWQIPLEFEPIDEKGEKNEALLNVWDFAGQDLYHNTHRLFMESRAIFVICDTEHGGGSCEATDPHEEDPDDEEGMSRDIQYWEGQVEALGRQEGIPLEDLVIRVRTKVDRGGEAPEGVIAFSAKTKKGKRNLEREIRKRVTKLLGQKDQRTLPADAMAVKNSLKRIAKGEEVLKDENDRRKISLTEACELVKNKIPTGYYHDDPMLLIRRFHRSGFLFCDQEVFRDWVILDQRWVLEGIYAIMARESPGNARENLIRNDGRFRASQLKSWVWDSLEYAREDQELFIQMMLGCGTCFELLRDDEAKGGEAVYQAAGFLASRDRHEALIEEIEGRKGESDWREVEIPMVSASEAQGFVTWVGEHWGRSAQLWRWGGRFQNLQRTASVMCDWIRPSKDHYTGQMRVVFYGGRDERLEREIRGEMKKRFRHPELMKAGFFEDVWPEPEVDGRTKGIPGLPELSEHEMPGIKEETPSKEVSKNRPERNGIQVTFSLAGGKGNQEIPLALADVLRERFRSSQSNCEVVCYLPLEGEERLSKFTANLAVGDLVLIFLSKKYYFSEYCMPELHLIYEEAPKGRFLDKRIKMYALDGEVLASESGRENVIDPEPWREHWLKWADARVNKHLIIRDEDGKECGQRTIQQVRTILKRRGVWLAWQDFLENAEDEFEPFLRTLCDYRLVEELPRCDGEADREVVNRLANEIVLLVSKAEKILAAAEGKAECGEIEEAAYLLQQFFALENDSNNEDFQRLLTAPSHHGISDRLWESAKEFLG